jgi:hypothetical protein
MEIPLDPDSEEYGAAASDSDGESHSILTFEME